MVHAHFHIDIKCKGKQECNCDTRSTSSAPIMILTWPQIIIREHQLSIGEARIMGHRRLIEHPFELRHGGGEYEEILVYRTSTS